MSDFTLTVAANSTYGLTAYNGVDAHLLQGRAVASTAPTNGQLLGWDSTAAAWGPKSGVAIISGQVGIGTAAPLAPLHVGAGTTNSSTNSQILISNLITDALLTNGHAFSDSTVMSRTLTSGSWAYNSFDARVTITGSGDYNHYAAFQVAEVIGTTGAVTYLYGLVDSPTRNSGALDTRYGVKINELVGTGTVGIQYGIYVAELTKGATADYAIYTEGATPSKFNGVATFVRGITVGDSLSAGLVVGSDLTLSFDGSGDYVTMGAVGAITEVSSVAACSTSEWLRPSSYPAGTQYIQFNQVDANNRFNVLTVGSTDRLYVYVDGAYGYVGSVSTLMPIGQDHHLVVVYDGTGVANADRLKVYVNNVAQTLTFTGSVPATLSNKATAFFRVSSSSTTSWNGRIKRKRVYNRALTVGDVADLFVGTAVPTGLVHYWAMDEGTGTAVTDTGSNAVNGTVTGATWAGDGYVGIGVTLPTTRLSFPADTTVQGGISWGNDTFVYRSAANQLTISGALVIGGALDHNGTTAGFFGQAPTTQPLAVADATGAGDVVARLNDLLARVRSLGLIAT